MPPSSRTFRIFISSTFNDLEAERNALQENVFQRLRDLAMTRRCRFQAIDLRWGISEEAALDQRTMNICLGEIERCQRISPRPNFIILLGDRFGWRPLPYAIPADEFERLLPHLSKSEHSLACWREGQPEDAQGWYRLDENAVPPEYVLLPRQPGSVYADYAAKVERPLVSALERAARLAGLDEDALAKYSLSATGQEIAKGAMQTQDACEHVFCYFREIDGLPQDNGGCDFHDADPAAAEKQYQLKARLKQQLPGNVHEYTAFWQSQGPTLDHLEALCEAVYADLSRVMLSEMTQLEAVDPLSMENIAHEEFGSERARNFVGRAEALKTIAGYIAGRNSQPQVIWGASGSGKSALMARAVQEARQMHPQAVILTRFISATPGSSNGRALLEDLCRQITRTYEGDESAIPTEYRDLMEAFPIRLALANASKPLIIFLDALDQLSAQDQADQLAWLPVNLPEGVHMILSILPGMPLERLMNRLPSRALVQVEPMSLLEGVKILDAWLHGANRCLTEVQRGDILAKFKQCGGLPLYLKLAFEEAHRWRSFDGLPLQSDQLPGLSADIPGILHDLFWRLEQESNHGHKLVAKTLGYLAAARNGLSEDEILDVLWADPDVQADFFRRSPKSPQDIKALPVVIWSRLYLDLEPYLAWRQADGTELLGFYHRQLSEAVHSVYLTKESHAGLSAYYITQPLNVGEKGGMPNLRKLSEMVYQQVHAGQTALVEQSLFDFNYIQVKLVGHGVKELIDDYKLVPEVGMDNETEKALTLLQDTLRLSRHVLEKDPSQLPCQLTGRLLGIADHNLIALLEQVHREIKRPWLRPIKSCFDPPGGSIFQTLEDNQDRIEDFWVTKDGRWAITNTDQRTSKVWDLEKGECILTRRSIYTISEDGRYAISSSPYHNEEVDYPLDVWDLEIGEIIHTLDYHIHPVSCVAITPDGKYAISGGSDWLIVWDLEKGAFLHALDVGSDLSQRVEGIAVLPDGNRVLLWGNRDSLVVCDIRTGKWLFTLAGHQSWIKSVSISADNRRLATYSKDKTIKVWDLESGNCLRTLAKDFELNGNLVITPDGRQVIGGTKKNLLVVWDTHTGRQLIALKGHLAEITTIVLTPDGKKVVSAALDNTLKIWDLETGKCLRTIPGSVKKLLCMLGGRRLIAISNTDTILIFTLEAGASENEIERQINVLAMESLPGARQALVGLEDRSIHQWNLVNGMYLRKLAMYYPRVSTFAITPNGQKIVLPYDRDMKTPSPNNLAVLDIKSDAKMFFYGHSDNILCTAVTPDGRRAISGSLNGEIIVWDLEMPTFWRPRDWERILEIWGSNKPPVWRSKFKKFFLKFLDWSLSRDTGVGLQRLTGHTKAVTALAVTPNGKKIITGSDDTTVKVWELTTGRCLCTLVGHENGVTALAVSPDGQKVLSGARDHTLKVWDLDRGECLRTIEGFPSRLYPLIFSLDGQLAIWGAGNKTLTVWDLKNEQIMTTFVANEVLTGIIFASDGLTINAGSDRIYCLFLENCTPGVPILTAWQSVNKDSGLPSYAFGCPFCRAWSEAPMSVLGTIIACPSCGRPVKLNPFTIDADWRPIARVWKGYE